MEQLSARIVSKMIDADVITYDDKEVYIYNVQVVLEKTISYLILLITALIIGKPFEICLFFISFSVLRKYSGGIHCSSFLKCLCVSTVVILSSVMLCPYVSEVYPIYQGVVIMSLVSVFIIGSINNPNIAWNESEYKRAKRIARMTVVLMTLILLLMLTIGVPISIRFYIGYGVFVCSISMLLEIQKKGGIINEKDGKENSGSFEGRC